MNTANFLRLIEKLKSLPPQNFRFDWLDRWNEDADKNCALGWATVWFEEIGIANKPPKTEDTELAFEKMTMNELKFFDISLVEYNYLFFNRRHPKIPYPLIPWDCDIPKYIEVLQQFMTAKHKEHNRWYNKLKRAWQKRIF